MQQIGYRARWEDIARAQIAINEAAVIARRLGPSLRLTRLENYTTPGPNFLWCLDGYDKFS
jgi:hypothetical protein